jgi:hypothetical protein
MQVRVTTYAYPWDLARLGVERALREIVDLGIDAIDLAATYHPIDALSPRDGAARLFTSPRGAVHFPARPGRYARIRPRTSSSETCAVWPEVAEHAAALGLAVNAWTVTLYQPWIVDAYPDCARVLPSGDPVGSSVCAANDDVREYLATLCGDIVDQFGVRMIRLEGVMPAAYDYGWLRPRVLVDVSPLARALLALCFCASCTRRANDAGLDVVQLRRLVQGAITAEIDDARATTAAAERAATLDADAELHAFVIQHERASIELAGIATSRFEASPSPRLSLSSWTPYSTLLGADQNALLTELIDLVDQVALFPEWSAERKRRFASVASDARHAVELAVLVAPRGARVLVVNPATAQKTAEPLTKELADAAALGVAEINLYNFGLLRTRDIRDFMVAVRTAFSSSPDRDISR